MKNAKWIGFVALAMLVAATLACGGGDETPTEPPTSAPPPTTVSSGTASLQVVNNSGLDVWYLYVSPSSSTVWGNDRLGSSILYDGESFTVADLQYDTYDVKAEDSNHNIIAEEYSVVIDQDTTWTIGQVSGGGMASLQVANNSGMDVWYLYVSPSSSTEWGDDQLGSSILYDGESFTVTDLPYDTYDVKAEDSNHNIIAEEYSVVIDQDTTWTIGPGAGGDTATLEIVNNSGTDIWFVYISPSGSGDWGDDQLGSSILYDGDTFEIPGIVPGLYDLKAEDSSHTPIAISVNAMLEGDMTWTVTGIEGEGSQWAISAIASSEYSSPNWSAMQATGMPDTVGCGDYSTAWASETSDGQDWLELGYAIPVIPTQINIYENNSPGFIVRVEVITTLSDYIVVWEGQPVTNAQCPRIFSVDVEGVDVPVTGVRIALDQTNGSWNEIDAVELIGAPPEG